MGSSPLKRLSLRSESLHRAKGKTAPAREDFAEGLLEARFSKIRGVFGYRRLELKATRHGDTATIVTPDFEYHLSVQGSDEWLCVQEVSPLHDRALFQRSDFQDAFSDLYDEMVGEFTSPTDLVGLIDRLEESPPSELKLDYDSQCRWAELRLSQFPGVIHLEPKSFRIQVPGGIPPGILNDLLDRVEAHLSPTS